MYVLEKYIFLFTPKIMKHEDVRKIVLRLYDQDFSSRKIMKHLGGQISKTTVNRWIKMFQKSGKNNLKYSTGRKRSKRTKRLIKQVKVRLLQTKTKINKKIS